MLVQGEQQPRYGMYTASTLFLERLHRNGHLVSKPEDAALFYVPILLEQVRWSRQESDSCALMAVRGIIERFSSSLTLEVDAISRCGRCTGAFGSHSGF